MDRKEIVADILRYCRENIRLFDERARVADDEIEMYRCPLSVADYSLYDAMTDCITDYCEEHGLDPEDFDADDIY